MGLPHAVAVSTAEVTDRKGALQAFKRCKGGLDRLQSVLCDSGYVGKPFAQGVREIVGQQVTVQIAKRNELHTFKVMPKRWAVERSFAWLEKNRRLWKNCERVLKFQPHGAGVRPHHELAGISAMAGTTSRRDQARGRDP
jgi:transposase